MSGDAYSQRDIEFLAFRQANPTVTFAQYHAQKLHRGISSGASHHSLGSNLPSDFWDAGEPKARYYFREMSLKPGDRVIEYGCGSLRIGGHFIRFLEPGGYYGLDVIADFYEMGTELIGPDLLREKKPSLAVISDDSVNAAAQFGAGFVYSSAVCIHVHPDETETYFHNLLRLAGRPGSRLFFNAAISDNPMRFRYDSWAWPMSFYERALADLELVKAAIGNEHEKEGLKVRYVNFEFRRADAPGLSRAAGSRIAGLGKAMKHLRTVLRG